MCSATQNFVIIRLENHKIESQKPPELKMNRQPNLYTMTDNQLEEGWFSRRLSCRSAAGFQLLTLTFCSETFPASDGQLCSAEVGTTNQFRTASTARADDDHEWQWWIIVTHRCCEESRARPRSHTAAHTLIQAVTHTDTKWNTHRRQMNRNASIQQDELDFLRWSASGLMWKKNFMSSFDSFLSFLPPTGRLSRAVKWKEVSLFHVSHRQREWLSWSSSRLWWTWNSPAESAEQKMNNSASLMKSQSYKKSVDIKTEGEKSTTTPRVHFSNKHPITELKTL